MPKVRTVSHGRMRARYNPVPTAAEKAYHLWLIENFPCACGCFNQVGVVHHPLTRHPAQRWRRDHEYVVPMNGDCHMELHRAGKEPHEFADMAHEYRVAGVSAGILKEVE